ncbi:hypothetical protein [Agaribacterium sp. ZY112]|uniref:hypothetical protein n=1 Tax=Agaribacterium sp. ZY112 TaxID=3233574 RepID=UPI003525DED9
MLTLSSCTFNSTHTPENKGAENTPSPTPAAAQSSVTRAQKKATRSLQATPIKTSTPKSSIAAIYLNRALLGYIHKSDTEGYLLVSEQGLKLAHIEQSANKQYSILLYHNKPDNSGLDFHYRDQFPLLQTAQGTWLINWPLAINDHAWQLNTTNTVAEQKKAHFLRLLKYSKHNLQGLN